MLLTTLLPALVASTVVEPAATYPAIGSAVTLAPRADEDDDVFSYSYIEVGATRYDVEDLDDEADTYYGEASIELFHVLNIFLGYENSSFDFDDLETDQWTLGAGLHFSVMPKLDLTGDFAWLVNSLDGDNIDEDTDDFQLRLGARWMVVHSEAFGLELFGRGVAVTRDEDVFDDDRATGFDAGVRAHIFSAFSVAAEYSKIEDDDQIGVSARFSF